MEAAELEPSENIVKLIGGHLAVRVVDHHLRAKTLKVHACFAKCLDAVVKIENLSAALDFKANRARDFLLGIFVHESLNRLSRLRGSRKKAHVADFQEAHVKRSRNRSRAHREAVDIRPHCLEAFLVLHSETLLLVDYHEPEVSKFHVVLNNPVGSD